MNMKNIILTIVCAGCLQLLASAQDASDIYTQHQVLNKGDQFLFINENTQKRANLGEFDNKDKTGEHPSFKMFYPEKKQEIFFFRLRHPLVIQPYTSYELRFKYKASDISGEGPYLEFATYDDTRETLVASHTSTITENNSGWTEKVLKIETKNKVRFARLLIKSHAGGSGRVLVNDVVLKQLSEAQALKLSPVKIYELGKKDKLSLPADRNYYLLSAVFNWDNFEGDVRIKLEWFTGKEDKTPMATDEFLASNMQGVLPQWNGLQMDWKRNASDNLQFLSRKLEKRFNQQPGQNSGSFQFNFDKPPGAGFLKVSWEKKQAKGKIALQQLNVEAEF